ncbi:hypothetical protein U737_13645 [Methylomonas sp. LW13]|uniref:hypothetical protein n=1 Tax=unclassified Methylomonas TaxID=2608980 RepID=UPI00051C253F|nr:hypothetical protein [Methylomonas sp. LW13]QBC27861.1 hypothetical protein U737_13645 [Methylomonas sp. LW13]
MNIRTAYKTSLVLILSSLLVVGCSAIKTFLEKRVALATGVNFETGKIVALNPESGKEVAACIQSAGDRVTDKSSSGNATKCTVELLVSDNNPELTNALELSKKLIQGEIKKNGKTKSARFVISVTTLYEGSDCNVVYSGGNQYENCNDNER